MSKTREEPNPTKTLYRLPPTFRSSETEQKEYKAIEVLTLQGRCVFLMLTYRMQRFTIIGGYNTLREYGKPITCAIFCFTKKCLSQIAVC